MADFEQLRVSLRQARDAAHSIEVRAASIRERLKRIHARQTDLDRRFRQDDQRHLAERERLAAENKRAQTELERERARHREALAVVAEAAAAFSAATDPRDAISRLDDATPILLMPVRLETRFKEISAPAGAETSHQLWVRIYPDDCWIDTFDPVLTESEVLNARTYWTGMWQAGGIEDQERGAWRGLVGSHGSGRAAWIADHYQPVNLAEKPSKPRAEDVILTIGTDVPVDPAVAAAASAFWRAVWLADGDAAASDAARGTLEAAVGAEQAQTIVTDYVPTNFDARIATGLAKADVNVAVAFIVFPASETKQSAWSRAPKITILPERFVFIGYQGSGPPLVVPGNPVRLPLAAGPDPAAVGADQLQHDEHGNLLVPDDLLWMSDFDRAVDVGMAFRIPLTEIQAQRGFERVLVVGLRVSATASEAATELETLLDHHAHSRTGLSLVPQGTPTNNTESAPSGHGRGDDADRSFDDRKAPLFTSETNWLDKRDGQWVAEYLGIDAGVLTHVHGADATDQAAARAMNIALWPATLGYWMETMMAPVFPRAAIDRTNRFFNRYVLGSGAVPAIRIGSQPYGILPATRLSRMRWLNQPLDGRFGEASGEPEEADLPFLRRLHQLLLAIENDWRQQLADVSFVGKAGDPHQILLDIVGLHPGSVEWSQRYAESLETLFNRLYLAGLAGSIEQLVLSEERLAAAQLLRDLGYSGTDMPQLLDKIFSGTHNLLKGGVDDDKLLSEVDPIRSYTPDGRNYIQWLIDAATASLTALYEQDGFIDDSPPRAIVYLLLRHALQLGYHDVSVRLHETAGLYTAAQAATARRDDPFLHVRARDGASESRYQPLLALEPAITGSATQTVSSFIAARLASIAAAAPLREQLDALERLVDQPTARLERVFADHVDCCAYRLDAWLLGLVNFQLALMRNVRDRRATEIRHGIHLGGYAWIEDLRPEHKVLTPAALRDPELSTEFEDPAAPPLMRDSTNEGYIHAPSLNHAVTAAVLRNGFLSNASPENRQTMAVNLTSGRVRVALALLEGIRAGQGLSDLLGYQFERGLHDAHALVEVDKFIYKLRKEFPLRADRLKSTKTGEGVSIEAIEARNVIDGLAFVTHMKSTGKTTYPFGKTTLPSATDGEADAINGEAQRLLDSHDAVADLALCEGVYQAVVGNYDRVASTYDAYARGHFPPEPDVVRTPFFGIGLTCRVALHLEGGASPAISPIPGVPLTPRAQAEPALNTWLARRLPSPDAVGCIVAFRSAATGEMSTVEVRWSDLDLQPADLMAILSDDARQAMSELDDRVVRHAKAHFGPRPDAPVTIRYLEKQDAAFSFFELMPLVRYLRRITSASRPLKATDLALMNEARAAQDEQPFVDKQRIVLVRTAMDGLRADLAAFKSTLDGPLSDLENRRGEILANVDDYLSQLTTLLARAATFALPQAGWGFAYDFARRTYAGILQQTADVVARWERRLTAFDDALAEYDSLPVTTSDEDRFRRLTMAEAEISTVETTPLPATPAAFRTILLTVKRPAFVTKRDQLAAVQSSTRTGVSDLRTDVLALLPITDFDATDFTLAAQEDDIVRFAEDAVRVVSVAIAGADRKLSGSQAQLEVHDAAAAATGRVRALEDAAKTLLGDDFRIVPEFTVAPATGDEIENALAMSRSGELFTYLTNPPDPAAPPVDFPVETWMHGVARVREKVHAWEQMGLVGTALGAPEPVLDALQLPVRTGDKWLGLEFPPDQPLDTDKLLYNVHFDVPFNKAARQCGLLVDEWSEVIPGDSADTGVTFHHDRPNSEAPQAMLLVTPSQFRGAWEWDDLVDALNETLEFAKRRAIEPKHIDRLPYAPFLPATMMATQARQLTIAANLGINNSLTLVQGI